MRLFHTGTVEITGPDIYRGRKNADFGQGFYLTPDREFTYRWAGADAIVNEYELDTNSLAIHTFDRSEDWFTYIFNNRRANDSLAVDVVIGPIANDTIFDTLGVISSGFLTPDQAMQLLMIGPEYTQVAIKSQKAVQQLRWIGSEKAPRLSDDIRKAEGAEYENAFAEALLDIVGE